MQNMPPCKKQLAMTYNPLIQKDKQILKKLADFRNQNRFYSSLRQSL